MNNSAVISTDAVEASTSRLLLTFAPVILSFVTVAAHFLRSGTLWMAVLLLLCPFMLMVRHWFAARMLQLLLVLVSVEWLLTAAYIVNERLAFGSPWERAAMILGGVMLFTLASALVFFSKPAKAHFRLGRAHRKN